MPSQARCLPKWRARAWAKQPGMREWVIWNFGFPSPQGLCTIWQQKMPYGTEALRGLKNQVFAISYFALGIEDVFENWILTIGGEFFLKAAKRVMCMFSKVKKCHPWSTLSDRRKMYVWKSYMYPCTCALLACNCEDWPGFGTPHQSSWSPLQTKDISSLILSLSRSLCFFLPLFFFRLSHAGTCFNFDRMD